jgi:alkylation response protein AidB-like acyl-CoA dehydrogenase
MIKNPYLTEEHELLRKSVRDFAERHIKPVAQELDEKGLFSEELTRKMGEIGLFGMTIPHEYGGQGLDNLSYIIAVEELARIDSSQAATIAAHNSLGVSPLFYFGNEEQRRRLVPQLCTGEHTWAFGLTEPNAGSDSRGSKTTARLENDEWVINGSKIFITNGASDMSAGAIVQVVSGETAEGHKEFSTIIVEKDTPGFTRRFLHGKMVWRASDTSELFFDNVRVPKGNLLGKVGQGSKIMLNTLDGGRLSIGAMGLGLAQGAYELALNYSKERKQFGKAINRFQSIAFKLADMATRIEAARHLLYHATWLKDQKLAYGKEAAMAKLFCSEVAKFAADEAVQIFGGYGLMADYQIERFFRDQKLLQIGEGTSEIQRLVISRHIIEE